MSDFNQDMENLLHAYDSNWQDYLILREQFIEKYKLSVEKLQEQLNTAKKALTESEEKYQKQMDRFLNSEMNESARSHCESQLKLLFPAHKAFEALAAIGGDDDENRL